MKSLSIYLAGPEVFLPDGYQVLQNHKRLCESRGFVAFTPLDGELPPEMKRDLSMAKRIFEVNCELIRKSDIIIANCNFFEVLARMTELHSKSDTGFPWEKRSGDTETVWFLCIKLPRRLFPLRIMIPVIKWMQTVICSMRISGMRSI